MKIHTFPTRPSFHFTHHFTSLHFPDRFTSLHSPLHCTDHFTSLYWSLYFTHQFTSLHSPLHTTFRRFITTLPFPSLHLTNNYFPNLSKNIMFPLLKNAQNVRIRCSDRRDNRVRRLYLVHSGTEKPLCLFIRSPCRAVSSFCTHRATLLYAA
jgi:hypothetical protein